jgi:hypothetical protein
MTTDESLGVIAAIFQLRREIAGVARSVDVTSAHFVVEWRAALEAVQGRLDQLAALEKFLEPVLAPAGLERFTVEQLRAWIVRMARRDEEGWLWPVDSPTRGVHPSVH